MDAELLQRRLDRAQLEIRGLEQLIESKTRDLYLSQQSLRLAAEFQENVLKTMASALVVLDPEGRIVQTNEAALKMLGLAEPDLMGQSIADVADISQSQSGLLIDHAEIDVRISDGTTAPTHFCSSSMHAPDGSISGYVCVWVDLREKKQLEVELRHAQKLESLGQMAAGVAHEINTPIQYVGDTLQFLQEAFTDMQSALQGYRDATDQWKCIPELASLHEKVIELEEDADIAFIDEEAPGAFTRASGGLSRVSKIVKALKSFCHPGSETKTLAQVNEIIENTLTLAATECKYVADVEADLGELPDVPCHPGDLGQVILNLVVNAAHAIEEKVAGTEERGRIRISSHMKGSSIAIDVEDSGAGIPDDVRSRIFDPFFTTKEVGKGTGQGLAIARRIIVDKHGGHLDVTSKPGVGTCFHIELPIDLRAEAA